MASPVLKVVEPDKLYILQTDALELGFGAVLSQLKGGEEHPMAYVSRKLLPGEKNYSVIEMEYFVIVVTSGVLCNCYNMGINALPDMYSRSPRAMGPRYT